MRYLVVGLGNPGARYESTRHNVGFRIIKLFAEKHMINMKPALIRAKGVFGEKDIEGKKVQLLLPLTYMNLSGDAVQKCRSYYKIPVDHILVVTDDVDLPFGAVRVRAKGGSGGHNGLKSIESHLGQDYSRVRIGVGGRSADELAEFVLDNFTHEEQQQIPEVFDRALLGIETWIHEGVDAAMQKVNRVGEK